jgi:hypothetical protein
LRIYEGSPRQDFEEVFRAIGAVLDERGYREILVDEVPDGFIVQGLRLDRVDGGWTDAVGHLTKETLTFFDDEIGRYMDEAVARRGKGAPKAERWSAHYYEEALRVIGRYLDQRRPRDVMFFEQEGGFVVRMLIQDQAGSRHELTEFTRDDVTDLLNQAARQRAGATGAAKPGT